MRALIPASHLDLVDCPPVAALTTVMPNGDPQTSVVWCDFDGTHVRVNTMRGFQKERNMRRNPRVTLLCYDPRQPLRSLEIRGTVVEMTEEGAGRHLDSISPRGTLGQDGPLLRRRASRCGSPKPRCPVLCRILPVACRGPRRGAVRGGAVRGDAGRGDGMTPPTGLNRTLPIPASHLDLLDSADLRGPDDDAARTASRNRASMWVDVDGECARVNTTIERLPAPEPARQSAR